MYVTVSLGQRVQNDGLTLALNAQAGALRWKASTGGTGGTASVANGAVYVATEDSSIRALDAATGKQRWAANASSPVDSAPAVAGGAVFVATESGAVRAFRASDCAPAWSYSAGADALITSGPVVAPAS